jgi:hypothetical protein
MKQRGEYSKSEVLEQRFSQLEAHGSADFD